MRVTIIPSDGVVGVDGVFKRVEGIAALFPDIHAIQWSGTIGHIEFSDGSQNEVVDAAFFAEAVNKWNAIVPPPPDPAAEKLAMLAQARLIRETVLNRLTGIQVNTTDAPTIAAIQAARIALLNITADAGVLSATDGAGTKAAVMAAWQTIALTLATAASSAASVFVGLGM